MSIDSKSTNVVEKTVTQSGKTDKPEYVFDSNGTNVLNNYRLFGYVFTLSAVSKADINDPTYFKRNNDDLIILKTGGKGNTPMSATAGLFKNTSDQLDDYANKVKTNKVTTSTQNDNDILLKTENNLDMIGGFNKNSPGRFDMFIDNVEIETIMGFSEAGGTTQPTKFTFEVFEPYSINGFIEALHAGAVAAGYPTYTGTPFLLKMEFLGYPDSSDLSAPQIVPKSTRYFPIVLTNLEVTLNETGTRYQCTGVPFNEAAYGNPSQLKKSIKMSGNTVKEILNNLMEGMNKQVIEADESTNKASKEHDEYKIGFPDWVEGKGWDNGKENKISGAKVTELLKDNSLYKFPDPGSNTKSKPTPAQNAKQPESFKLEPGNGTVQFPEGKSLHECIQAIIRDSKYIRNIVEKLSSSEYKTVIDEHGMVDYFLVKIEVANKAEVDPDLKRPHQIFTFTVTPYKILYTRIPNYGNQQVDIVALSKLSLRQYNYIYTGKNVDILNFKLNFNTLFFEAIPAALGNDSSVPSRDSAARSNSTSPNSTPDDLARDTERRLPAIPKYPDPELTEVGARDNAVKQDSAYYALAKSMHNAIINSKGSMITGEIDILGDPVYLVTGGLGSQSPVPSSSSNRVTTEEEANFNLGEVLITINFKNPVDIDTLENGGRLRFDSELIPFSGIYRINRVRSTFKDGVFKQTLDIIRAAGQPFPTEIPTNTGRSAPSLLSNRSSTEDRINDVVTVDSTPANNVVNTDTGVTGSRPGISNLMSQLNRGLPSPGLPGQLSNFTAATGGLGGTVGLTRVSGAIPNLAGAARLGENLFANGIPINAIAAVRSQLDILSSQGIIQQVGTNLLNTFGISGGASQLAKQFLAQSSRKINLNINSIPGSGIGVGSTFNYTPSSPNLPASPTFDNIPNVPTSTPTPVQVSSPYNQLVTTLPDGTRMTSYNLSDLQQTARREAEAKALSEGKSPIEADSIGNSAGNLAGANALANINQSNMLRNSGPATGMSGIVGQTELDASQLSGLSPNLTSKVNTQVTDLAKNIPADTSYSQAISQGITLDRADIDSVKHLPPTQPYSAAPNAQQDSLYLGHAAKVGGQSAVARSFGVTNISQISQNQLPSMDLQFILGKELRSMQNPLTALPLNILDTAINATKYVTNNSIVGTISGLTGSKEGQLIQLQNRFPGSPSNVVSDLGSSVTSKFGSKSSGQSPLDKLMIR